MTQFNSSAQTNGLPPEAWPPEPSDLAGVPPVGITPPQILAQQAAEGQRGAAWRLLSLIIENDPRAVEAVSSYADDRLAENLLEFIALGTWAGKQFVIPSPLRSPFARTRLRTLFVPPSGIAQERSERVLLAALRDRRTPVREAAIYILGLMGSRSAVPELIQALHDPQSSTRLQAAKALGRTGSPEAVPALLNALSGADERMSSQIFMALVGLSHVAVPMLLDCVHSNSSWMRWHSIRALGAIRDPRALPFLVNALQDVDHSVAWMAAKGLVPFGRESVEPVLHMLTTANMTPWVVETASYVLHTQCQAYSELKPYLDPLLQQMHQAGYRAGTGIAALKALEQLRASGVLKQHY
ncbi:MAG TPA: HEAT repeat domain-containing protein [Ktedonobacteraceae bacterium]